VLGKSYFVRQAASLLRFAKSTSDPQLAAALVSKAAELTSKAAPLPEIDASLKAPDVEPENQAGAR
jgi:hypothetical protein